MSERVTVIASKDEFQAQTCDGVVLVDFFATWCGPCQRQMPILESVAQKAGDTVRVCKVNIENLPDIAGLFGVERIPTLVLLKNGKEVQRFEGIQQESGLLIAISAISEHEA